MTDSFFGGSHGVPANERCRIDRPYARVSRDKMQANLKTRLSAAGVTKIAGKVDAKTVRARKGGGGEGQGAGAFLLFRYIPVQQARRYVSSKASEYGAYGGLVHSSSEQFGRAAAKTRVKRHKTLGIP